MNYRGAFARGVWGWTALHLLPGREREREREGLVILPLWSVVACSLLVASVV